MSRTNNETDAPLLLLKDDAARQRWEMFHRAIAYAKQSNHDAMDEHDMAANDSASGNSLLSVVR